MDSRGVYELLKSSRESEKLLADPKQTVTALLSLKYGIYDSKDSNTLGCCLMALCSLLTQSSTSWSVMEQPLVDRIVSIATQTDQASNVVCPALSIIGLVALETRKRKYTGSEDASCPDIIASFNNEPNFIPVLVSRLANTNPSVVIVTLQVINSVLLGLFLDPNKRNHIYCSIRESGLFLGVSQLIENKSISPSCRAHLYDLQEIVKSCIKKTKDMSVDPERNVYHKQTYELANKNLRSFVGVIPHTDVIDWDKAGVSDDTDPVSEFNSTATGWAGMLDLNDFFAENRVQFKKLFLEQVSFSKPSSRFPLIPASLAVTEILYNLFKLDEYASGDDYDILTAESETLNPPTYIQKNDSASHGNNNNSVPPHSLPSATNMPPVSQSPAISNHHSSPALSMESGKSSNSSSVERLMTNMDKLRPLFFDWPVLHFSGISNFMRIWQASCAEIQDFDNIKQVMKILFEKATQHAVAASSSSAIENVISKLDYISYDEIRATQMKQIENRLNARWGEEIRHLHRQYHKESQDFVREQRVRLLLNGDWFFVDDPTVSPTSNSKSQSGSQQQRNGTLRRYFIALSPSRKSLQYGQFPQKYEDNPNTDQLSRSVDLSQVSKVSITPITHATPNHPKGLKRVSLSSRTNYTKISLIGNSGAKDGATLSFYSDTPEKAAAWGDGLLMLKNRAFQSADTKKYIDMFAETKLRMQILNLSPEDLDSSDKASVDSDQPASKETFDRSEISTSFYYK